MPSTEEKQKKRKRVAEEGETRKEKSKKDDGRISASKIEALEVKILESPKHYNSIPVLLATAKGLSQNSEDSLAATLSLCRSFCRMLALGQIKKLGADKNEALLIKWLKERYTEFLEIVLQALGKADASIKKSALAMLATVLKQEGSTESPAVAPQETFSRLVRHLLISEEEDSGISEAKELFFSHPDMRYHTFVSIRDYLSKPQPENAVQNAITILSSFEIKDASFKAKDCFMAVSSASKKLLSQNSHQLRAQEAWLALLKQNLSETQLKTVLHLISTKIAPWFAQPERLMDFLTDAYDAPGNTTSLLALSGLWYLIRHKNLDYPSFYLKLYSLLDEATLKSKNRSQFLRLMNIFLCSSHLPAALVASFVKRLARLSLRAPPGAIVFVVPWIYNMIQRHPTLAFMIHRETWDKTEIDRLRQEGQSDPFNPLEPNPMVTNAIESSLWELVTLQSHYQPHVASLSRIISESFTKPSYEIDDFLGMSYSKMLEEELRKNLKKAPVVEYEIPKCIFFKKVEGESGEDSLLVKLWNFS